MASLNYTESFETGFGSWVNDPANLYNNWARNSGGTGSSGTGPAFAYDGSYYIFCETSNGSGSFVAGDTDIIEYDIGSIADGTVSFRYSQYGEDQGTLSLEIYNGSSWDTIWSSTGNRLTQDWLPVSQSFSGAYRIRFRNVAAGGFTGDVALDSINITATVDEIFSDDSTIGIDGESTNLTGKESDTTNIIIGGEALNLTGRLTESTDISVEGESLNLTSRKTDSAGFSIAGESLNLTGRFSDSHDTVIAGESQNLTIRKTDNSAITLDGAAVHIYNRPVSESGDISISGLANITATRTLAESGDFTFSGDALNYTDFRASVIPISVERFWVLLTGDTDLYLPISNFNGRFQSGNPIYFTCTVPDYDTYAAGIVARANGELVLMAGYEYDGDIIQTQEILRVDLENINTFNDWTITLDGYRTQTLTGQNLTLDGLEYKDMQAGKRTFRFPRIDFFLRPGDTLTVGETSIEVGHITYTVDTQRRSMTVVEAS